MRPYAVAGTSGSDVKSGNSRRMGEILRERERDDDGTALSADVRLLLRRKTLERRIGFFGVGVGDSAGGADAGRTIA